MDEKTARQYDYKANSNLVLPTDTKLIDKRPSNEATGEVQSLVGRIKGKMGDRISDKKPDTLKGDDGEHLFSSRDSKRHKKANEPSRLKRELIDPRCLSVADIETKDLLYQPKSDLTAAVYGLILKFVRRKLGFQHDSVINGAVDEILIIMKNPDLDEQIRRSEIEQLLLPDEGLSNEDYNELSNLCKKIVDWDTNFTKAKDEVAEEISEEVGVILSEEDDSSSEEFLSEIQDSDDDFDLDDMFEKAEEDALQKRQQTDLKGFGRGQGELTAFLPVEETLDSKYKTLNLEEISKKQCNIIPKAEISEPLRFEGYQEYHIKPRKRSASQHDIPLVRIQELPEDARNAFNGIKSLNLIQSSIYRRAIFKGTNPSLLICAPTGAGKTNIAILTMLEEIIKYRNKDGSEGFDKDRFKIIYVAPIKALVQEIVENFSKRLGAPPYDLKVEELTGDHQLSQRQISRAQIIVCTPEKWDIVTRKSLDRLYTKLVRLVIFDEIHLLHNERGATLEALVARIKRHKRIEGESIRIVGLSATLPNYQDVARFIAPEEREENSVFYFDSSYRPIPLSQQYIAMMDSKKSFKMINDIVYDKVIERIRDNAQILIFVHSRPDTSKTAEFVKNRAIERQELGNFLSSDSISEKINEFGGNNLHPKLRELLEFGIGTHHAGMSKSDRSCVENMFRNRYIKLLVSTATLAWGVNLPARVVIIKGTQVYRDGRWTDLDSLDVTQMLGRAGRPGFDKEGEGIVITQQSQVQFYMSLMNEQLPVESRLISRLPEFVNAECVIGNIESLEDVVKWVSETFLNSRMVSLLEQQPINKQHLALYGLDASNIDRNDSKLIQHKHNLAYTCACLLDERGLIVFDRHTGSMKSTDIGRISSDYNCSSRTIKTFYDSIHEHTSDIELFRTFSLADEFKDIYVRRGEESDLQVLLNQVPFPIDDKRATPGANKVNALLQVYIFRLNIEGSDLICDMHSIRDSAARLARAIHEIVLLKGYAMVAELSFDLCRKIDKRMTVCHTPLRQFSDDLDADIVNRLEKKNYQIEELRLLSGDELSRFLRCERHQGERICKFLKFLPRLKIEASVKPISVSCLKIDLQIEPDFTWNDKYHGHVERFWFLVEDNNQEIILHHELVHLRKHNPNDLIQTSFLVPYMRPSHPFYFIRILPDGWFGCDQLRSIHIGELTLPNEQSIITQPLDLELQTIRSLENSLFEGKYVEIFRGSNNFNQIQTQTFKTVYLSDDDIILLASAGSGKTVCAELAAIRNINLRGLSSKIAFISANKLAASVIYEKWTKIFDKYSVKQLTGSYRLDCPAVDDKNTNIVVGDVQSWHSLTLTRSKKYRKMMSKFQLFIIDDIHLLHNDKHSILEWLCSKIRILTKLNTLDGPARLVVLGSPITCADSLKNWLALERGITEPIIFNFPPSIRPVRLDMIVQKFHNYDYRMRVLTMIRPIYRHIVQTAKGKPVMIFVADFSQAQNLCSSLINYSCNDKHKFGYPMNYFSELDQNNEDLIRSLKHGIGYIHAGMSLKERRTVEELFESERIQILVVTSSMCWAIKCRSYMTIIMDTQQHNGLEATDYDLTDIMQMIGSAGRPLSDHECKCIVMCQHTKADSYERLLREPLFIESDLPGNLITHVNFEVACGSLVRLNDIYKPYLAHTLFYKRISINPNYYGIIVPSGDENDSEQKSRVFGSFFNDLVNKVSLELEKYEFISIEGGRENPDFTPGLLSKISLEYYISFETLANYSEWFSSSDSNQFDVKPLELIELLSTSSQEFTDYIQVRHGELTDLKRLQRRHRPREGDQLHLASFKTKLLILSQYQRNSEGKEDSVEGELKNDRHYIISMSYRLLMAIVDIAWLKDSFSLAKTSIQLAKKLTPFNRSRPNLDMNIDIVREDGDVKIIVSIDRENDPFSMEEFLKEFSSDAPIIVYRDEGWCFLLNGRLRKPRNDDQQEKFVLFKRVKTPVRGSNEYVLSFALPEDHGAYTYDLYFMSDFYSTKEDRKVPDIKIHIDQG